MSARTVSLVLSLSLAACAAVDSPSAPCDCADGAWCTPEGTCVEETPATGDVRASLELIRQIRWPAADGAVTEGFANLLVWPEEAPPTDDRAGFASDAGERCTVESGSHYPFSYGGTSWPSGPFASVGRATVLIDGAPGPIVLEPNTAPPEGTFYWTVDQPPPVSEGDTVQPFFDADRYLPAGAALSLSLSDVAGAEISAELGLVVPDSPVLESPALEPAGELVLDSEIELRWAPSSVAGAEVEVAFAGASLAGTYLVRCSLIDDGSARLPTEALVPLAGYQAGLYISRVVRRRLVVPHGDARLFAEVVVRSDRVGPVSYR